MPPIALETILDQRNRTPLLVTSAVMIAVVAVADWWTMPYVSLGFLYLFPIMLVAGFLPRPILVALGVLCAIFSEAFSSLDPTWRASRLAFEVLALAGTGLFVSELLRNRRLTLETQQRIRGLVDTSPAAIITVNDRGIIELANKGAIDLLAPKKSSLIGEPIGTFVPELQSALGHNGGTQFRTSMQCLVHRSDGQTLGVEAWFSTYMQKGASRLTAIIADISEEQCQEHTPTTQIDPMQVAGAAARPTLNTRQVEVLRLVFQGLSTNQMASRLGVTSSVIRNTLQQLFLKGGVNNRSQMVRVALERYRHLL